MSKPFGLLFFLLVACPNCEAAPPASESGGFYTQSETKTLTIQEVIRMTLARSPEVSLAEAQSARAGEALRETRSLNRPQLVTGTGLAYNNGFPLSIEGAAPSIIQVAVSQSIFSKKNGNLVREAEETGRSSQLGIESARNELASKTALVYYELHQARKIVPLASARLDTARKQQKLMETLLEAGRVRRVDLTLAKTAATSAQQQLLVALEQAKIAEKEIWNLTGLSDAVSIQTVEPQIDNEIFGMQAEAIYRQALESTPEIRQAEANVRAKEFHVEAAKGEGWPQMEIVSQYALFSRTNNYADYFNHFTRHNYILGLSIQVPLFNGHRTGAKVAQSRQEVAEANYRLQQMKLDLKLGIERNLSAMRVAKGAFDVAHNDVEAAQELVQVNEALLEGGRITPKELEDLRSQLHQKALAQLDADQSLFQRKVELLRLTGSISSSFQ